MELDKIKSALETIASGYGQLAEALESVEEKDVISPSKMKADAKGKRGRKAKVSEDEDLEIEEDEDAEETDSEDEETEEDSDDDEAEESDEDDSDDEEESEDEDESVTELELKTLKSSLKKYSAKNGKAKAVKILKKFAKTSQDVKRKDFAKLLKLLKV